MENYVTKIEFGEFRKEINAKFTELLEAIGYYSNRMDSKLSEHDKQFTRIDERFENIDRQMRNMATKADLERSTYELKQTVYQSIREHERVMHA